MPFRCISRPPVRNQGINTADNANTYTAHEQIIAGYIQTKFNLLQSLQVVGGVRVENTQDAYNTALPSTSTVGAYGTIHYTDVLPSVHFKYALTPDQKLPPVLLQIHQPPRLRRPRSHYR
jgi:outer membrane receptor protein involved in Fe transport